MLKRCTKCDAEKPLAEFHNATTRTGGKYPRCKTCRGSEMIRDRSKKKTYNQRYYEQNSDKIKAHWFANRDQNLLRHAKYYETVRGRAVRLINSARKSPDGCTLTLEHVIRGIESGNCPVTGIAFDLRTDETTRTGKKANPFAPSLDRINCNLGYTNENTRVVIWQFNAMKGELSDAELFALCRQITARIAA